MNAFNLQLMCNENIVSVFSFHWCCQVFQDCELLQNICIFPHYVMNVLIFSERMLQMNVLNLL